MVPHLVTALTVPINELEQRLLDSMPAIERWFRLEWMEHTPPFYSSVDIRNAGFKVAPVDTNLFPTGWQNLAPAMVPLAVQAAMAAIEKICPEARNLLLIPENQARCTFYLSNVAQLQHIFRMAGLNVRVGSISPDIKKPTTVALPDGQSVTLEPVIRKKNGGRGRLGLKDFDPCTILLNNDLSAGLPGILEDIHEQFLLPPLHAGWTVRRKSNHFRCYEEVAKRFGKLIGVDHWLITPLFEKCEALNLAKPAGVTALATHVDSVLAKIRRKYKEYGISERPFVVIKADDGGNRLGNASYESPAQLMVRDARDLAEPGKLAAFMGAGASRHGEGSDLVNLIVQEGVLTNERMNSAVAEPVVYMMDRYVVGGVYRIHAERGVDENLNAPGSRFVPLAFAQSAHLPQLGSKPGASAPNRFYMYGVIARLALVAASYEMEATDPEAELYA
jgi:glutamate--cysteine ligase